MVLWVGIGAGTIFSAFQIFDHGVVKFDHVVVPSQKKPFAVPKSHKGTIYVLRGVHGPVSCGLYEFVTRLKSVMQLN